MYDVYSGCIEEYVYLCFLLIKIVLVIGLIISAAINEKLFNGILFTECVVFFIDATIFTSVHDAFGDLSEMLQ